MHSTKVFVVVFGLLGAVAGRRNTHAAGERDASYNEREVYESDAAFERQPGYYPGRGPQVAGEREVYAEREVSGSTHSAGSYNTNPGYNPVYNPVYTPSSSSGRRETDRHFQEESVLDVNAEFEGGIGRGFEADVDVTREEEKSASSHRRNEYNRFRG